MRNKPLLSSANPLGQLLQRWRHERGQSQLSLALDAGISPRHLSFIETGRTQPSRDMVLRLAETLGVPFRERNHLLTAAGFAHAYRETGLTAPEITHARRAIELILEHQEPFPAVVMDRHWNLVTTNKAAARFFGLLLAGSSPPGPPNVIRLMFHPDGLRPWVANWPSVAKSLLQRVRREAVGGVSDDATEKLLQEILAYPDVPDRWSDMTMGASPGPLLAIEFRKADLALDFFSTVTTLGTPQDITLQEIRIECFFPANESTARSARGLAQRDT